MDGSRFDTIVRSIAAHTSRRELARLAAGSAIGGLVAQHTLEVDAKKKKKGKKKKCKAPRVKCGKACCAEDQSCLNGQCSAPPPPPPPPSPPPGPNPVCPGPPNFDFIDQRRYAQTFAAERTGQLVTASCQVTDLAGGEDFTLEIRTLDGSGKPSATVLGVDTIIDVPTIPGNQTLELTAIFDPPVPVQTGTGLALVVTIGSGQSFTLKARGNACPGQQFFRDTNATDDFEQINAGMVFAAMIVV